MLLIGTRWAERIKTRIDWAWNDDWWSKVLRWTSLCTNVVVPYQIMAHSVTYDKSSETWNKRIALHLFHEVFLGVRSRYIEGGKTSFEWSLHGIKLVLFFSGLCSLVYWYWLASPWMVSLPWKLAQFINRASRARNRVQPWLESHRSEN